MRGKPLLLPACLLLFATGAFAQQAERWYQIELIVFQYLEPIGVDGEEWPATVQLPDIGRAVTLLEDVPEFGDEPEKPAAPAPDANTNARPVPVAFRALPESELRLSGAANRMARARGVTVLRHVAWRQPSFTGNPGGAPPVYLRDEAQVPAGPAADPAPASDPGAGVVRSPRFEGTVRLRIGRYVYVDADLLFMHEGAPIRLFESRRMRLGELHYLDHPLFGMLVQVLPYRVDGKAGAEETVPPAGEDAGAVDLESESDADPEALDGAADD